MYFTALPDHSAPGFDEGTHFSQFRQGNIIFNAQSKQSHCRRHIGCLSIKTVFSGEEWYGVDGRRLAVRPGQFLILNDDQEYSSSIDTTENIRILSIFFRKEFAGAVYRDVLHGEESLLDDPFGSCGQSLEFFQTLTDIDQHLGQQLTGLTTLIESNGYDKDAVDECLVFLLNRLIRIHHMETAGLRRVRAARAATKKEIYKRLCVAKDLLHSCFMEKTDITVISHTACLSAPQLIRQFKAVFRTTPHQYLIRIRLANAARLLKQTADPIHEITWKCGFENTSAFCRAFRLVYGVPPQLFRQTGALHHPLAPHRLPPPN